MNEWQDIDKEETRECKMRFWRLLPKKVPSGRISCWKI